MDEDVVWGLGPLEWLGMGIVMTVEVQNVCANGLDAAIDFKVEQAAYRARMHFVEYGIALRM
ncbi:hypothetical protein XH99_06765 [Bradyrhizobium nanningense]|uniref:Uncharacterized protein n=1 Tax=Bradyrhizobium nanningense TaxID=1325118 RepID=A0A4Q0SCX3_9BRAD|nr:hypothetical protein [Bradyrhizobium nanningense]RXH36653.1 hypothetical protein XH99_06765 [Bradyrhizobium nanningense]